jgi:hypothetical protein
MESTNNRLMTLDMEIENSSDSQIQSSKRLVSNQSVSGIRPHLPLPPLPARQISSQERDVSDTLRVILLNDSKFSLMVSMHEN